MVSSSDSLSDPSHDSDGKAQFPPNWLALAILKEVEERQKDRRETDPSRTQELIQEARAGGVHGFKPDE